MTPPIVYRSTWRFFDEPEFYVYVLINAEHRLQCVATRVWGDLYPKMLEPAIVATMYEQLARLQLGHTQDLHEPFHRPLVQIPWAEVPDDVKRATASGYPVPMRDVPVRLAFTVQTTMDPDDLRDHIQARFQAHGAAFLGLPIDQFDTRVQGAQP